MGAMTAELRGDDLLETLRSRLDGIDERMLEALRERLECCIQIAHVKREHDVPMMQPHRIGVVHRRAAEFAAAHQIDPEFLRRLYDLVIAETCRLEDLVITGTGSGADTSVTAAGH